MNNLNKYLLAILLLLAILPAYAQKQIGNKPTGTENGWFVGVHGGVPFGVSTFSSFGSGGTLAGYSAGLYGGYRFSPVLSLEATAKCGEANLSARGCCTELGYWLGSDGVRYNVPVLDMEGWGYDNLKSSVFVQHYGLQLNVNVLGFFNAGRDCRWTLEVSPLLAAVGTKAVVNAFSDGASVMGESSRWHLGFGGNLQAGFHVTRVLKLGIYSGLTFLDGKSFDGMPQMRHGSNYIWESGVKVGFVLGK